MPWYGDLYQCKPGRPTLGVTKKVSVTLPEEVWEYIEEQGNKSAFFRILATEEYKYAEQVRKSLVK